jgi:RNA polymerase sigma factor (TIGR02999 family)
MSDPAGSDFSSTLSLARAGDPGAAAALFPVVYAQLRRMAGSYLRGRPGDQTLQPTALVHEAFLRMCHRETPFADRAHFIAVAATAMRQILIDRARRAAAKKRGEAPRRVTLEGRALSSGPPLCPVDVLALDAALRRLAELSPRQARIVELQFFGGMTTAEVAEVLGVSTSLVEKDWRRARAWIRSALAGADPGDRAEGEGGR